MSVAALPVDNPSHFQLLAPFIPGIDYGSKLGLHFSSEEAKRASVEKARAA